MVQVVRWYLSSYHAGRKSTVAKKPYNPILGEVFQCHWDIAEYRKFNLLQKLLSFICNECVFYFFLKKIKENETDGQTPVEDGPIPWCRRNQLTFIAEQVSHHPPSKELSSYSLVAVT